MYLMNVVLVRVSSVRGPNDHSNFFFKLFILYEFHIMYPNSSHLPFPPYHPLPFQLLPKENKNKKIKSKSEETNLTVEAAVLWCHLVHPCAHTALTADAYCFKTQVFSLHRTLNPRYLLQLRLPVHP